MERQMKLISQKKLYKRQSKKQGLKQQKLKQLWTAYENLHSFAVGKLSP